MSNQDFKINRFPPPPPVIIYHQPGRSQPAMNMEAGGQSALMMGMDEATGDFHLVIKAGSLGRLQEFARTLLAEVDARLASGGKLDDPASLHINRALLNGRS